MTTTHQVPPSTTPPPPPAKITPVELAEVQRKVGKAKSLLILDHPFFGTAVTRRPIIYTEAIPTAAMAATGQMRINPTWVMPLTVKQLMFLLAHEALHYMLAHGLRRGHRTPKAWNVACDKVINDTLIEAKVGDFIEGGINFRGGKDYAAEELYDENDDGGGNGPGGIGNDVGNPVDPNGNPLDESQISQLEAQAKVEAIQSAKAAKAVGKLPASLERMVDNLIKVVTPWDEKLERFMTAKIKSDYSWARPNRRFIGRGLYLPGVDYKPQMGAMVIGFDMSGSIGQPEIDVFGAHANRIIEVCQPEKVYVVYCDSAISHIDEFTPDDYPCKFKAHGGGGTAFQPVFEWIDKNDVEPEAVVYLTDGYGDQNSFKSEHDTIWVTTQCEDFNWGEVVKIEEPLV
jgi:predicted metal-dependent peptidase